MHLRILEEGHQLSARILSRSTIGFTEVFYRPLCSMSRTLVLSLLRCLCKNPRQLVEHHFSVADSMTWDHTFRANKLNVFSSKGTQRCLLSYDHDHSLLHAYLACSWASMAYLPHRPTLPFNCAGQHINELAGNTLIQMACNPNHRDVWLAHDILANMKHHGSFIHSKSELSFRSSTDVSRENWSSHYFQTWVLVFVAT